MSKVAVIHCENYNLEVVYESIKKGINLLGGLSKFINNKEKILLKPNLLFGSSPEKAIVTHPVFFEAVIKIFLENKINICYGDSPGMGSPEQAVKKSGLYDVAQKYNVPFAEFNKFKAVKYNEGLQNKQFDIVEAVLNVDGIVNLPKMKTHQFMRITGAVKNLFGCIQGLNKAAFHAKLADPENFSKMLADLAGYLKPRLHIMDGIVAMEGNGPASGDPVNMNVILISDDPVALDAVFCRLINIDPELVYTNISGEKSGLGSYKNIEIIGDDIEKLSNKKFKVERGRVNIGSTLKIINKYKNLLIKRPVINHSKCVKCFKCVESCPLQEKAININKGDRAKPPVYNYDICIRCYCCQEMCPYKAIEVKTPLLGKLIFYR